VAVAVVWFVHTTLIDRLDVTKLAIAVVAASIVCLAAASRPSPDPTVSKVLSPIALIGIGLAVASIATPGFVLARVESWAPWVPAVLLFSLVRSSSYRLLGGILALAAGALAALGIAQATGLDWFVSGITTSRPVMGTLGNADVYGVCLAGALPFALIRGGRPLFRVLSIGILAAVILSGSRTAWVMLLPSIVVGIQTLRTTGFAVVAVSAVLIAGSIGHSSDHVSLQQRVMDLSDADGTAAGRVYLWRVHVVAAMQTGPVGGGPGAFQRRWPWAQSAFLREHPEAVRFHSDLRHAHADAVEILLDWGWIGFGVAFWWVSQLLRRRRLENEEIAARASLTALLIGGLAVPVLFQTPSLLLAAVSAGMLAEPRQLVTRPIWRVAAIVGVALTLFWTGQRVVSEALRSDGLRLEVAGALEPAAERYRQAAELDPENPLALIMMARSLATADPETAFRAIDRAVEHLPTAPTYILREVTARRTGRYAIADESRSLARMLHPGRAF
jgi:hypothetical protein